MPKSHLTKEYERDISLIIEGLWAQEMVQFAHDRLGSDDPPRPFIVFYVSGENVQIWENAEALAWYKDALLKKNKGGYEFIDGIVSEYKELLVKIQVIVESGPSVNNAILKEYISLVRKAIALFSAWYYSLADTRTPEKIRKNLLKLRSDDEFFSQNDMFIKRCLELLGIKNEFTNFVFPDEFPNAPKEVALKKRLDGVVSLDGEEYMLMSLKEFADSNPNYFFEGLNANLDEANEIRGQVAFTGKIAGKVHIVKNAMQMLDIKSGEILVSPMTTPDFLPAMKKAAAIVTDEGGITCHAAIVSRELKIPCVIGTKTATKVLKDGDLVEVDADKGIVKILKKA